MSDVLEAGLIRYSNVETKLKRAVLLYQIAHETALYGNDTDAMSLFILLMHIEGVIDLSSYQINEITFSLK